jgi:glutamine synthetase type III
MSPINNTFARGVSETARTPASPAEVRVDWKQLLDRINARTDKLEDLINGLRDRAEEHGQGSAEYTERRYRADLYRVEQRVWEQLDAWLHDATTKS